MDHDDREKMRAKRAAELEAKKKKLEEMRRRKGSSKAVTVEEAPTPNNAPASADTKFDDYIQNLLKSTETETVEADNKSVEQPVSPEISLAEKLSALSTCSHIGEINILPMIVELYAKHTQTVESDFPEREKGERQDTSLSPKRYPSKQEPNTSENVGSLSDEPSESTKGNDEETKATPELTKDEIEAIASTDCFQDFLSRSSRIVERALDQCESYDIMVDYGGGDDTAVDSRRGHAALELKVSFFDERWTKNRAITDIDTSPIHKELVLASYNSRRDSTGSLIQDWQGFGAGDPDGVVLLWSTALTARPEYVFTCSSPILTARFDPFNTNLIIGGSYSGQIFRWDTRAKSAPINRTPLSANGHTHPVYCLDIIGNKNAHSLVSGSTDGKICVWSPDQWIQPTDTLELQQVVTMPSIGSTVSVATSRSRKLDVALTSMSFRRNEINELSVGSESGAIYKTQIHNSKTSEEEQSSSRERIVAPIFEGHFGPITSMHYNPLYEVQQDALLLSSSVDWSCKLWSHKSPLTPLMSFETSNDYVYDVRWSPIHPALFATADGAGVLALWNINNDSEVPTTQVNIGDKAINRARWSVDGRQIAIGDSAGSIHVYDVSSEVATPRSDEKSRLEAKISNALAMSTAAL